MRVHLDIAELSGAPTTGCIDFMFNFTVPDSNLEAFSLLMIKTVVCGGA